MTKRWSLILFSSLNVIANLLMIWPFNSEEKIFSNLFLIIITLVLLPSFLRIVDHKTASQIRLEISLLIILTAVSIMRLLYRLGVVSDMLAIIVGLTAIGLITVLLIAGIIRWIKINKNID
ncbi:hypothetical protein [Streptococcus tangpeifui]|uniref:hypothetical protein n=1 Tax=Streptococcus tangpeifui TaxID=2709400 RepID=UPI0013ECADB4|nr:hypothetical protein [Streptococcus sp. ZJ373]